MLNYFWTSVNGGRGRQHLMDGTTVEHSYYPGETRHETYGPGEYKVHDLENLGDEEMIFNTIEFLDSANKPLPVPDRCRGLTPTVLTSISATARLVTASTPAAGSRMRRRNAPTICRVRTYASQAAAHPAHCRQQAFGETSE